MLPSKMAPTGSPPLAQIRLPSPFLSPMRFAINESVIAGAVPPLTAAPTR